MIALGGLLLNTFPFLELLRIGEGNAVHALKRFRIRLTLPVRRRVLDHLQCLHLTRIAHVRSTTQINQWTTPVHGGRIRGYLLVQDAHLELVVLEHPQQIGFLHLQPFERLLLLHDALHLRLECPVILVRDATALKEHVVVETIVDRRSIAQVSTVALFHGLSKNVRRTVPKDGLGLGIVKLE
uniref:Putative secreted peptide n=1 Tax=Anopheles braziliensis TaxID=58242 RepID=A0A2M3ZN17_9DIPT